MWSRCTAQRHAPKKWAPIVLPAVALVLAGGVAAPIAATGTAGCTTHQCDTSTATFAGGHLVDPQTYETSGPNDDWISFPGQVTLHVLFPPGVAGTPVSIDSYIGTGVSPNGGPDFQGGNLWSPCAGELCEFFFLDSTGFYVLNASCATYYARFVVHFAPRDVFTVFGGTGPLPDGGTGLLDDTWTYNGSVWTDLGAPQQQPCPGDAQAPPCLPGLSGASLVSVNGTSFLNGGVDETGTYHGIIWQWLGASWNFFVVAPPDGAPLVLPNPARADAAATAFQGQIVLFGGTGPSDDGGTETLGAEGTWTWEGTSTSVWVLHAPPDGAPSPPPRFGASMAALKETAVLFGGSAGGAPLGDTWTWDGSTWTQVNAVGPSARVHAAMAAVAGRVVLFGGNDGTRDLDDAWLWDGSAWAQVTVPGPPARSAAAAGVLDGRMIVFGGLSGGVSLADTWTWDGVSWTMAPSSGPEGAPSPRSSAAASGP
jgi:hypothetical protein